MNATQAVIFDVDGVLVDSADAHFRSWQALAAEIGHEYTHEEFLRDFGRTSREIIAEKWPQPEISAEEIREMDHRKEVLYREIIAQDFPAMDGAVELMRELAQDGFLLAIGSSGPPENVNLVVERLGIAELVGARINGALVERGKPDPQVFQLAAKALGVCAPRCVVVEDAAPGIAAAHAAGMKCVALVSTGHSVEELSAADVVVHSLRELTPTTFRDLLQ